MKIQKSFDVICRRITIGNKQAAFLFIDGFCKDELAQKLLQFFMEIKEKDMPRDAAAFSKTSIPHVEVDLVYEFEKLIDFLLSGVFVLLVDTYQQGFLLDTRTYPARAVEEPGKDKVLRGSKDGFVETIVMNTALIRRRIRDPQLVMEMVSVGSVSKTDVVICYMDNRVNEDLLKKIKKAISEIKVEALTMNQESLAELLFPGKWWNPFPKFKYTERPDVASAQLLEGNIIILVDNSPSAMVLPANLFTIMEEAEDYYFPPITGAYLRITRLLICGLMYLVPPLFLLTACRPDLVPEYGSFIKLKEIPNIPVFWQFILLELAIDGLRLAAVNTPNMLSTPLSVMAALVLGEFSVNSGWFSPEVMLYMAFVAIANYTQPNYELGYAIKYMRLLTLLLVFLFELPGFIIGVIFTVICLISNKTLDKRGYLYPLFPFSWRSMKKYLFRKRG